ncbi:hypothetical protein GCM10020331_042540 [Ectobacillus funiculus]
MSIKKMRQRLQVSPGYEIRVGDVAQITADETLVEHLRKCPVYQITKQDKTHVVIDAMKVIEAIRQHNHTLELNLLGPAQTIVEIVYEEKNA